MAVTLKYLKSLIPKRPLAPIRFPVAGFKVYDDSVWVEEEIAFHVNSYNWYPVNIGDVIDSKYQVLGKLGYGSVSTVWLARNLINHDHVALKVFTREGRCELEYDMLNIVRKANKRHPGYGHVRTALDMFRIQRDGGDHACLVQEPMWDSWRDMLVRCGPFTEDILKTGLKCLFLGLDYLHRECKLVHTDIKAENVLQQILDETLFEKFTASQLVNPSPRKFLGDLTIYGSEYFSIPAKFGPPVLADLSAAVRGEKRRDHIAQPDLYRAPEVMLKAPWSYPVDIWNAGVMIWDLMDGKSLFSGRDDLNTTYRTKVHLAEMIGVLGMPPQDLLERGKKSSEFFSEDGKWIADVAIPGSIRLEDNRIFKLVKDKEGFLNFLRCMLQWRPEDRKTAKELGKHAWLCST